jgi:cytochrome c556
MKRKKFVAVMTAATIVISTAGAFAHGGATGIVKERMDLMASLGKSMKSLTAIMQGKVAYDVEQVRQLARGIGSHGSTSMSSLFPAGSDKKPSEALPNVWKDWNKFTKLADQLSTYAKALESSAGNERMMSQGGMPPPASGGMMSGNQGMMPQSGSGMMGGNQSMMMGGAPGSPSAEQLAKMPPQAAFMSIARTCSSCHQDFRKEK